MTAGAVEILIYAAIAAFLVARLRGILGEKRDDDPQHFHEASSAPPYGAEDVQDKSASNLQAQKGGDVMIATHLPSSLRQTLTQMNAIDDSVTYDGFMQGAVAAFPMISEAFAAEDLETLKSLLGEKLYKVFARSIEERQGRSETLHLNIRNIVSAEVTDAYTKGGRAHITVKFTTVENRYTTNADKTVVDGDKKQDETVVNLWTFTRKLGSESNIWQLETTKAG